MEIVNDRKPVVCKPYRVSLTKRETIGCIVREWKETKSSYTSPVLLVKKNDGDARLVVNYRKLNAQTARKVFLTPNLDEYLEVLYGTKMFTTLHLASG